jgi:hypothetical protein
MRRIEYLRGRCERCKRWRKLCGRALWEGRSICTRCDGCAKPKQASAR